MAPLCASSGRRAQAAAEDSTSKILECTQQSKAPPPRPRVLSLRHNDQSRSMSRLSISLSLISGVPAGESGIYGPTPVYCHNFH